jgi:hypothetical protein
MLCIRYPYNSKYNYFSIDEKIQISLENLFNTVIKSEPVVKAMQNDTEAKKFEYIFYNNEILEEFAENTHLVIFPFSNYSGYIDKMSFDIYLDIYIKNDNDINMILSKFEVFLISKLHEYKHGTRIYMKIFNKSNLKTPNISFRSINISNRIKESIDIISKASINYPKNSILFKTSTNEYGESFEEAGAREALEETGLIVKNLEVFCVQTDKNEHAHFISVGMIAREFEGIPKVKEQEMVKWEWFDLDKLPKNIFSASKKTIDCFLNHKFYIK